MTDVFEKTSDVYPIPFCISKSQNFTVDGVECAGIEGFLQSLKASSLCEQQMVCGLSNSEALEWGKENQQWKNQQLLYWDTKHYGRLCHSYRRLITRVYDEMFQQYPDLFMNIKMRGYEDTCHRIGKYDPSDTVLTELEMLYQINRLRINSIFS